MPMIPFEAGIKVAYKVDPGLAAQAARAEFWHPAYSPMLLANTLAGIFTGGVGPAVGGLAGGILTHKLQTAPGTLGESVRKAIGTAPAASMFFGSVLGQLLARSHMSRDSRRLTENPVPVPGQETKPIPKLPTPQAPQESPASGIEQATEPEVYNVDKEKA